MFGQGLQELRGASECCPFQPLPVNWLLSLGREKHNWQLQISKLGPISLEAGDRVLHLSLPCGTQASPVSKQRFHPLLSLSPSFSSLFRSAVGCDRNEVIFQFTVAYNELKFDKWMIDVATDDEMRRGNNRKTVVWHFFMTFYQLICCAINDSHF